MADTISSFISPARIKVLLVPIHPIKRAKFERYAELIRGFGRIQLADVPSDVRGDRAAFSSSPTTPGALLFEYLTPTTYASSHPLAFLSEFQIHRRIHGIIGILDCSEYPPTSSLSSALAGFQNSLADLPKTFATKIYGFEPSEKHVEEVRKGLGEVDGLITIPATGDIAFYLNTLLADFASEVLWDFSNLAAELESRTSIPTPQETSGPVSPFTYIPHRPTAKGAIQSYAAVKPIGSTQRPINLAQLGISAPPQSRTADGAWGASSSGNQDGFLYGMSIQSNMQVKAVPSPPPGAQLVDQKARKKVAGREKKLMGDMWVLSGRLDEAITSYNEAISLTKGWQDQVWQASALEGLCVALIVQAWSPRSTRFDARNSLPPPQSANGSTLPPLPAPDSSTFLVSIPERLSQAIALYGKMLPPITSAEDQPPPDPDRTYPLIYAESCLRCARFLLAVWESGGWIEKALERLILPPTMPRGELLSSNDQARKARLISMRPENTVQRSTIALWVSMAYSPHLATLALPLRLRITGEISSIFARIGYRRKESFVLRELAALCGEGVAGKEFEVYSAESTNGMNGHSATIHEEREDIPNHRTKSSVSSVPNVLTTPPKSTVNKLASIVRTTSDTAGNDSIVRVAEKVCEAFGIEVVSRAEKKSGAIEEERATELTIGVRSVGWPALQVGVLRDAIMIAEALPDYQAAIRFTVTALRTLSDHITPAEQYRLSQNIPRIFAVATRRGAAFDLEYWGPHDLVMSLQMISLPSNRRPFPHPYQDVAANAKATTAALTPTDPFIYNPKKGPAAAKSRPVIVQNEVAEVYVTLQNTFLFELEIQSIELSTSGVAFTCDPLATSVPPGSFHTVRLSGVPRESGVLTIRGCNIRLAGCSVREFLLPIWNDDDDARQQKIIMLDSAKDRVKASGLDSFIRVTSEEDEDEGPSFLECTVVPAMPLLWIRSTSLTHGALMLYDGEVSTIRIVLENASHLDVDFVKLTFSDMLTSSRSAYILENGLNPSEAYEIESDNQYRPVFTWKKIAVPFIGAGQSIILEVQCLGKVGCGNGTIQIDYALVDQDHVKTQRLFHTRQLFVDVFMTVHRALVPHSLDILRLRALSPEYKSSPSASASLTGSLGEVEERLGESLRVAEDASHCLLEVDVKNAYGAPFEIMLEREGDEDGRREQGQRLEPGATARMLLRLDRLSLSPETLSQPIPLLNQRQFVVSRNRQSPADERSDRESFWYREELFKRIRASWNEVGSMRTGTILLRNLQLTPAMLNILRLDEIDIQLRLETEDSSSTAPGKLDKNSASANEFVVIVARITNRTPLPLDVSTTIELLPPDSDSSPDALAHLLRYVVIDGLPCSTVSIDAGQSKEVSTSICLMAEGMYEFGCRVQEMREAKVSERKVYSAMKRMAVRVEG